MTTFTKPTIKEIYNTIISDYTTRTGQEVPVLKRALIKCFAYAIAGVVYFIWNFAEWQYLQIFLETCEFEALKRWGNLVDITYKSGVKSILSITLLNVSKSEISAGTIWKSLDNGLIYKSISTTTVNSTTVVLNVECSQSGSTGNLSNDSILNITNPIAGLPEIATVSKTITTGTNDEEVETYRTRVINRYKRKPQGGSAVDYYDWSTEVSGIVDCFPYVLQNGIITLYLVASGSGLSRTPTGQLQPNTFPQWQNGQMTDLVGYGQFLSVAKAINSSDSDTNTNDRRPLNTQVQLLAPNYTEYKVEIVDLDPISDSIIASIKTALIDELDNKKPNLKALGYTVNNATINSNQLSSTVQNIIDTNDGSFTSFSLKNSNNEVILTDVLGIGSLAYLGELKINGSTIDI
ncbi:MAG TPA: baseplate J/gp47 family protein [Rickettsiales bacterium]|nr:baseplate J/gp47 family protein [Rickettsiales bacterium]